MIASELAVAVGIVLFNNSVAELADLARTLHRALARLAESEAQASPPRATAFSIRLHNNGDTPVDPTPFGSHARLTSSPANLGFGRAHNLLMDEAFAAGAGTNFYLTLNPDGMLHPDALVEMVALARRNEGRALVEAEQFPEEQPKVFDPLTFDTPWASGCCLLIPAAIWAAIGGFDESMFLYCEDVDLSWRARAAGYAVKHAPRALFHHQTNRPGANNVARRARLDAASYLATKWGNEEFLRRVEGMMAGEVWPSRTLLAPLSASLPAPAVATVADFANGFNFAPLRWGSPSPIPLHAAPQGADTDNTIDIIVRFHDPAQIGRLSRCLFSLYGQWHQPIQALLMLQGLDDAGTAAVDACVDAFDWSPPRRRPIVTNVAVTPGDHRARLWNAGLDIGRARYLGFCDFDDTSYTGAYRYLLHRLQHTGAAAAFASALHADCAPMMGFDLVLNKRAIPGEDRYDFFVDGFVPLNSILLDRSRIASADLCADESLSRLEGYRVLAAIAARYDTDWAGIGTAVGDRYHRTDGTNTVPGQALDGAKRREWDASLEAARQYLATFTTKVPVSDIIRMRGAERSLGSELASAQHTVAALEAVRANEHGLRSELANALHAVTSLEAALADERSAHARLKASLSWRLARPIREAGRVVRWLEARRRRGTPDAVAAIDGPIAPASPEWSSHDTIAREVSVCIATHRRPEGLERLLASLVDQRGAPPFDVVVVDNDAARSGEPVAARFRDRLALSYLVEPVRGLARVRNRAVAAASGRFIALIDDDEWASPEWLAMLAEKAAASGANVVIGPVERVFADEVPDHIRACGAFDNLLGSDGAVVPWYAARAGNAFVRRETLPDLRAPFATRFDLTGGEDVDLFRRMIDGGARVIAAGRAVVFEHRPVHRANLWWVARRSLRNGGTIAGLEWGPCDWRTALRRTRRSGADAMRAAVGVGAQWSRDRTAAVRHLIRACQEVGKILHLAGIRIEEYRKHP